MRVFCVCVRVCKKVINNFKNHEDAKPLLSSCVIDWLEKVPQLGTP